MKSEDRAEFVSLLNVCYSTLLRPLPSADGLRLWENLLHDFSIQQVSAALYHHMKSSKFAPTPNDVIAFLTPDPSKDGRPEANAAWADALRSRDEFETVVWTTETAEAFGKVSNVLGGDEIGARMAFREVYTALCDAARAEGRPVKWVHSVGFDSSRREAVLTLAAREGKLSLEHVKQHVPALAAPVVEYDAEKARRNLTAMKALIANAASARDLVAQQRAREIQAEAERLEFLKLETAVRVAEYEGSHA